MWYQFNINANTNSNDRTNTNTNTNNNYYNDNDLFSTCVKCDMALPNRLCTRDYEQETYF